MKRRDARSEYEGRRSIRLKEYDYSREGAYFITICTHQRQCVLGGLSGTVMILNELGKIVHQEWCRSAAMREEIEPDAFVVMPNHVHGIIFIHPVGASGCSPKDANRCPPKDANRCSPKDANRCPPKDANRCSPKKDGNGCLPVGASGCSPKDANRCPPKDANRCSPKKDENGCPPVGASGCSPKKDAGHIHRRSDNAGFAKKSLASFVAGFKAAVTTRINTLRGTPGQPFWQRNYYEHVIRSEASLLECREYIQENPLKWTLAKTETNTANIRKTRL